VPVYRLPCRDLGRRPLGGWATSVDDPLAETAPWFRTSAGRVGGLGAGGISPGCVGVFWIIGIES